MFWNKCSHGSFWIVAEKETKLWYDICEIEMCARAKNRNQVIA